MTALSPSIRAAAALALALWLTPIGLRGQEAGQNAPPPHGAPGTQLILHSGLHVAAGPLAERFGVSNTIGVGIRRTTASGWRLGAHYRFQTGADVREPGLLQNLRDPNGHLIDNEGRIALVSAQQRGTLLHLSIGRKWVLGGSTPETGLIAECGVGFWEHKIHFQNRGNRVTQLEAPHVAGYDRRTGGGLLLPRIGWEHHSPSGQVRFQFGLEGLVGRMVAGRDWNADTQSVDDVPRWDAALGVFAGWILRLQARTSSVDYYY